MRRALLTILAGTVLLLVLAEVSLRFLPVAVAAPLQPVNAQDPVMKYVPNTVFTNSVGWKLQRPHTGRTNNDGFVNDQDYSADDARPLLAIVGDCFVESAMFSTQETVQGRLAEKASPAGRVYSFGIADSGLSQYLSWAAYAAHKYHADGIVISVVWSNFDESLSKYAMLPGRHYFSPDPAQQLELRRTDYLPSALRPLIMKSALARYILLNLGLRQYIAKRGSGPKTISYADSSALPHDAERVTDGRQAISAFFGALPGRTGLAPERILFVVDSVRPNIYSDEGAGRDSYFGVLRDDFMAEARKRGYETIDLNPSFEAAYRENRQHLNIPGEEHWNSAGHAIIADAVAHSTLFMTLFSKSEAPSAQRRPDSASALQ